MTFAAARPRSGRNRSGRVRGTFDRYVVMRRSDRTLDEQMGATLIEAAEAVALKASITKPLAPSGRPPAGLDAPVLDADGWKGWWTADGIETPPRPEVPVVATTEASPLVWRSTGEVGGTAWGAPEVYEMRFPADVRERGGSEGDQTGAEVARTVATFRVRAANIDQLTDDLGSIPVGWGPHLRVRVLGHHRGPVELVDRPVCRPPRREARIGDGRGLAVRGDPLRNRGPEHMRVRPVHALDPGADPHHHVVDATLRDIPVEIGLVKIAVMRDHAMVFCRECDM